jgi:type IV pilus assembly protein PilW
MRSGKLGRRASPGFTLVELMIAITLGMLLVLAFGSLYVGASRSYRTVDQSARIQENARFALAYIARDLRQSGLVNCYSPKRVPIKTIANAAALDFSLDNSFVVYDSSASLPTRFSALGRKAGTDVLVLQRLASDNVLLKSDQTNDTAPLILASNPLSFKDGEILAVADCTSVNVFHAKVVGSGTDTEISIKSGSNSSATFDADGVYKYARHAALSRLEEVVYFIKEEAGVPKLFRLQSVVGDGVVQNTSPEVLVEDVTDLQVQNILSDLDLDVKPTDRNATCATKDYEDPPTVANAPKSTGAVIKLVLRSPEGGFQDVSSSGRLTKDVSIAMSMRNRGSCQRGV